MNSNPQIYHGEWWVPATMDHDIKSNFSDPKDMMGYEKKYTGTLTYYGDEDSSLELYHLPSSFHSSHYKYNDIMWGRDANGHIFTLFNVVMKEQTLGDMTNTKFVVGLILLGEHVLSKDEKWSKKCVVHFSYLNNWLFYETKKYINPTINGTNYHLEAVLRDKALLEVELEKGLIWRLCHNIKVGETVEGISINKNPYFEIESSEPASVYSYLRQISEFEQFISIALYGEQNSLDIQFLSRDARRTCFLLLKKEASIDPSFISLIKYSLLKDKLPSMLSIWHNNFDRISPISSYLIDSLQKKNRFDVPDFLIIAQALDGYHKRFVNKRDGRDIRKYEEQIEILLNKFKSVKVIKQCRINPEVVKDSRHKYSHLYPDDEKSLAVEGGDLYWLTEKCKILLTCCILNMLGLNSKEINLCCENSPISQMIDSFPLELD